MKLNRRQFFAGGLVFALLGLGLVSFRILNQKTQLAAELEKTSALDEPNLKTNFTLEEQGFVDCPDELEEQANDEPGPMPQGEYCVATLLPVNRPPQPFQQDSSLENLQAVCGAVFADFLFYHGEGRCQWGSAMFYGTDREIHIAWKNWKDKKIPGMLRFVGSDLYFENGLKPGMLLKDISVINGRALTLAGFGWDGSGFHRSFHGGSLQVFDSPESPYRIHYSLDWALFDAASDAEHASIIVGDAELESTAPALEKFKAHVEFIEYRF